MGEGTQVVVQYETLNPATGVFDHGHVLISSGIYFRVHVFSLAESNSLRYGIRRMNIALRLIFNALLLGATGLFIAGIFAPLMEVEKFWFFKNEFSLASTITTLWHRNETALFLLLFVFSILTPIIKIAGLLLIVNTSTAYRQAHHRFLNFLETWGKWSMLDVFVVALLFVAVKLGPMADVTIHTGLYLFAAAVVLIQLLSVWLSYLIKRQDA